MEKKTKTLFTASVIACACLLCLFSVSLATYVIGGTVEDQSSNISVTVEETTSSLSFTDLSADGKVVFGPTKGNTSGSITDESAMQETSEEDETSSEAATDTESLTVSVSFKVSASSSFSGYVTFSIEPEEADNYSDYVKNGYILDPVAGSTSSNVGNGINVVTINNGSATALECSPSDDVASVGVKSVVSDSSTSDGSLSFSVSLTITYGWGEYFDYMNPALADEQENPTHTPLDMITALKTMYSDFYKGSSDFKLDARIGGRVDASLEESNVGLSLTPSGSISENANPCQEASAKGVSYAFEETDTVTVQTTDDGRRAFIFPIELY